NLDFVMNFKTDYLLFERPTMSTTQTQDSPFLTEEIVDQIFADGELTRADRQRIKLMLLDESIDEHQLILIERVMTGVVQGVLDVLY
ncbi:hypothetical protein, partial [Microcoleus anatoxicus]